MNFWAMLFVLTNTLLCIRLLFFSDYDRQASRWGYRLVLFLVVVYVGKEVISLIYAPVFHVSPIIALLHAGVLLGALFMRPEYLPGNCDHDATKRAYRELVCSVTRTWFWLRHPGLHGGQRKTDQHSQ